MAMELVIIRPSGRWAVRQWAALAALAGAAAAAAWAADGPAAAAPVAALAGAVLLVAALYYAHWMRGRAPRAIVAAPEYLGVLDARGGRRLVLWASVRAARHATTLRGMGWCLETAAGRVSLLDIGVDPARWGVLWRYLWPQVARRGAPVRVDRLSNALYD